MENKELIENTRVWYKEGLDDGKREFATYLKFLLSNRLHPEYSIIDLRREVESKLKELEEEKNATK